MANDLQNTVQTPDKARGELLRLRTDARMKWRQIALLPQYRGIPPGTLCSFAQGRDIRNPAHRVQLGLPALVEIPACPTCGHVHTLGGICPQVTPVKVIVYEEDDGADGETITVVIKRRRAKDQRRRERLNLPRMTEDERRAVLSLTPEERLEALLEKSKGKEAR